MTNYQYCQVHLDLTSKTFLSPGLLEISRRYTDPVALTSPLMVRWWRKDSEILTSRGGVVVGSGGGSEVSAVILNNRSV